MKMKIEESGTENNKSTESPKMTRKEAFKKSGYFVLSAATMVILLSNPGNAQAQSSPAPPENW